MSIATLPPLLEGIWISVREALSSQVKKMTDGDYKLLFVVYERDVSNSIYAQGSISDEHSYIIEIESNAFLEEKLSDREIQILRFLGWQLPNSSNPNFWRECPSSWSHDLVALTILQALVRIGRLHPNSWFSFGSDHFGSQIAKSGAFWVSSDGMGLLCLRGSNPSLAGPIK